MAWAPRHGPASSPSSSFRKHRYSFTNMMPTFCSSSVTSRRGLESIIGVAKSKLKDVFYSHPCCLKAVKVLVTHHVQLVLPGTYYLVRMLDGRIDTQGTVKGLRARGILDDITHEESIEAHREEQVAAAEEAAVAAVAEAPADDAPADEAAVAAADEATTNADDSAGDEEDGDR